MAWSTTLIETEPNIHAKSNARPSVTGVLATKDDLVRIGDKIEWLTKWAIAVCAMSLAAWTAIAALLLDLAVS